MREQTKDEFCTIRIYKSSLPQIKEDQKEFQEKIGGGTWSIADTVRERNKILASWIEDAKRKEEMLKKNIKKYCKNNPYQDNCIVKSKKRVKLQLKKKCLDYKNGRRERI